MSQLQHMWLFLRAILNFAENERGTLNSEGIHNLHTKK